MLCRPCSLIDRRAEENGVSEASSPVNENVGFMAYNALAGVLHYQQYAVFLLPVTVPVVCISGIRP